MIKLYADGADMKGILEAAKDPTITGFTTNPTLMRQAGVTDYTGFAKEVIAELAVQRPDTNISLEVFADDQNEIIRQARLIQSWGHNKGYMVYIKIPVMYTNGNDTYNLIQRLSAENISLNVTAIFTLEQIKMVVGHINRNVPSIVSVFAGRIADTGVNPNPIITAGIDYYKTLKTENTKVEFLWASSREAYSYRMAEESGCDIITMPNDLIKKVNGFGKNLTTFSKETCQMFYDDAVKSGFSI